MLAPREDLSHTVKLCSLYAGLAASARLALRILDNHDHDNLLFQALIDRQVRDPNASQEVVNQAMAKLLASFPAKR